MFTGEREEREVDQVVGDHGTLPNDALYFDLKPGSTNLGEVDLEAMAGARPQRLCTNPDGAYQLFRVGDAWTSRNIHAAMLDSAATVQGPLDTSVYDTRFDVHLCPTSMAWKEDDFHQWGHVYCDEFHQVCASTYHPDGNVVIPRNLIKRRGAGP